MPGPTNAKQRKKKNEKKKKKKAQQQQLQQATIATQDPNPEPHPIDAPETPLESAPAQPTQDLQPILNRQAEYVLYNGEYYEKIPEDELVLYEGQEAEIVANARQDNEGDEEDEGRTMAVYDDKDEVEVPPVTLELPYIYDPGNGPRVKDFLAFMRSPFAAPQSQSFATVGETQDADAMKKDALEEDARWDASRVLPFLNRILPGELAAGIDEPSVDTEQGHQQRLSEQYLSGICSVTCFALATYNFGHAAVLAYSLSWQQLDAATQEVYEGQGAGVDDQGLSYY
ncbi:hypothetical protein FRC17_006286, partial [Serendipita sp. 399]